MDTFSTITPLELTPHSTKFHVSPTKYEIPSQSKDPFRAFSAYWGRYMFLLSSTYNWPTNNTRNSLAWKTPADVSFIAVIHVAKAKEAATHLFVNISLCPQGRMLTSVPRKTDKRALSVLAQTARDGKRSVHSIGFRQSAWTRTEAENGPKQRPQAQLL